MSYSEGVYAIRLHSRIRLDVEAAVQHLVEISGDNHAATWQDGLFDALATLATYPRRCPLAREDRFFKREVRQFIYRPVSGGLAYRILFTIFETSEEAPFVFILHVRHGARQSLKRAEARELEAEENNP